MTAVNEDARTRIKIYDTATGKLVSLPQLPNADITGVNISPSEKLMAFYLNGDRSPSNLYVYDFGTKKATKLTDSLNPEINPADLVDSQVIRYKSFDGVEIPSILYKPKNASAQNKVPAHRVGAWWTRRSDTRWLQRAHAVSRESWLRDPGSQTIAARVVMARRSSPSDDGKHGREPLWDCVEAKKYLASLGYVDEKKIGIIGRLLRWLHGAGCACVQAGRVCGGR